VTLQASAAPAFAQVALQRAGTLALQVGDAQGQVPGGTWVHVSASCKALPLLRHANPDQAGLEGWTAVRRSDDAWTAMGTPDATGKLSLPGLPPGRYRVQPAREYQATGPGFEVDLVAGRTTDARLTIE
jgi:hypothetical protein